MIFVCSIMAEKQSNFNFLRSIGIQEWILGGDSNFVDFSEWFSANISDCNIVTDTAILEYSDIESAGIILGANDLQDALNAVETTYPNIWNITESDVRLQQNQLNDANATESHFLNALYHLKCCQTQIVEDLTKSSELLADVDGRMKTIGDRCMQSVKELQEAKRTNRKSINDLLQCYTKPQKFPLFIHQMPLEQYFKKCDTFLTSAETYFGKNFAVQPSHDVNQGGSQTRDSYADILAELEEIKNRLYTAKYTLCTQRAEVYAQRKLIECLKTHNWMPVNESTLRNEVRELQIRNENILELKKENLLNLLEDQFEQIADKHAELIIYDSNKDKIERAKKRQEYLENIANVIADGLMNAECLWILMQLDLGRVKGRQSIDELIEKSKMGTKDSHKRCEALQKKIKSNRDLEVVDAFLSEWRQIMPLGHAELHTISAAIDLPENYLPLVIGHMDEQKMGILEDLHRVGKSSQNALRILKELSTAETQLLLYAKDGPVDKPIFWNMHFVERKNHLENELKRLTLRLEQLKQELQQFKNRYNSDTLLRQQRNLWIWFLKEPKNVLKAIKVANVEAQNLSKIAVMKPISGISRKQ